MCALVVRGRNPKQSKIIIWFNLISYLERLNMNLPFFHVIHISLYIRIEDSFFFIFIDKITTLCIPMYCTFAAVYQSIRPDNLSALEVLWHCGVRKSCSPPSVSGMVLLGIQISVLGFSLFIAAISFSAWYPLKEAVSYFDFRQQCSCIEPQLWAEYLKKSELNNNQHSLVMLELTFLSLVSGERQTRLCENAWRQHET